MFGSGAHRTLEAVHRVSGVSGVSEARAMLVPLAVMPTVPVRVVMRPTMVVVAATGVALMR